jgi:hypothetical protein
MKFAGVAVVLALLASGWPAIAQVRIPEPIRPPQVMVPPPPPPALPTIQPVPAVPACTMQCTPNPVCPPGQICAPNCRQVC